MKVLEFKELEASILAFMARVDALYFEQDKAYFDLLFKHGFRAEELRTLHKWEIVEGQSVIAKTSKNGNNRVIAFSEVPERVIHSIMADKNMVIRGSYDTYRRIIDSSTTLSKLYIGDKKVCLHVFRHYRIKKMYNNGLSIKAIQAVMGIKTPGIVTGYIGSSIITR